ncbi:hypothetical protein ACSAZL_01255 [Methanosarcina sp. T3]|uniref:hypothetical protein n=1 Tax=Methanosarcina sp. T3 TaxID=3439062 RepID=UPI003F830F47
MTLMNVPDFLIVIVELLALFPVAMVLFFVKFPDAFPIFWTIVKRRNFVCMLRDDIVLDIRPAKMESNLWKVFDGIGKKAMVTHEFESDPKDVFIMFGRPSIMVNEDNTRAVRPEINELISYMKTEMGLKTKREFENAILRANYLIELLKNVTSDGGYWKKNEQTGENEFIKISFDEFWDKQIDQETREFLTKYRDIKDGGLVLNGFKVIRIHDVEDYIDRHNPETYAANEIYIKRKAEASANQDLKKLIFIVIIISAATLLALLYLNSGDATGAAAAGTQFVPR